MLHSDLDSPVATTMAPAGRFCILVIEDDEVVGTVVTTYLRLRGHAVEHCTQAAVAQQQLARQRYDLVITDILMPDGDGLEVIQWTRTWYPGVRIIAISGTDSWGHSHLRVAELLGATRVMMKPFAPSRLARLVDEVMRSDA
jgi:two-component system response regulator HydG